MECSFETSYILFNKNHKKAIELLTKANEKGFVKKGDDKFVTFSLNENPDKTDISIINPNIYNTNNDKLMYFFSSYDYLIWGFKIYNKSELICEYTLLGSAFSENGADFVVKQLNFNVETLSMFFDESLSESIINILSEENIIVSNLDNLEGDFREIISEQVNEFLGFDTALEEYEASDNKNELESDYGIIYVNP
jgi:hypothetical protein